MELTTAATVAIGVATIAVAMASAIVGGVMVMWKVSSRFVTVDNCKELRSQCGELRASGGQVVNQCIASVAKELASLRESTEKQHKNLKASNDIQYYMLRSLVAHSKDLNPEQRADILNAGERRGSARYEV
jgi:hypothetical protein